MKCWTRWSTSWDKICQEKYQQPQICGWYHSNGRKRRASKEPFDEGERGKRKTWLKTKHSKSKIMASDPITSRQIEGGKVETVTDFTFLGSQITADNDCYHEIKRRMLLGRDITLPAKVCIVSCVFSSSCARMWKLDHKEGWVPKNWCFRTVVLEKTLESPLDCKEIQPVNPKGNQPCIFIGRTDAEAEAPVLWPPDVKNWLIGKDPDAGKDWEQEKGATEDEMVGWHHQFNGHEFEQTREDSEGQESLVCRISWGCKE